MMDMPIFSAGTGSGSGQSVVYRSEKIKGQTGEMVSRSSSNDMPKGPTNKKSAVRIDIFKSHALKYDQKSSNKAFSYDLRKLSQK